jgi:hypothetical protein
MCATTAGGVDRVIYKAVLHRAAAEVLADLLARHQDTGAENMLRALCALSDADVKQFVEKASPWASGSGKPCLGISREDLLGQAFELFSAYAYAFQGDMLDGLRNYLAANQGRSSDTACDAPTLGCAIGVILNLLCSSAKSTCACLLFFVKTIHSRFLVFPCPRRLPDDMYLACSRRPLPLSRAASKRSG